MSDSSSAAVPAPFSVSPSWSWDGDDGKWSTFEISVGKPGQSFRVLPSTTGSETWVPIPEGCEGILASISDCGTLRGVNNVDGKASRGFDTEASSSWELIGIYELETEQNLWGSTGNQGYYGLDEISLESYPPGRQAVLKSQTVAGVATANVWLGSLGLGGASAHFDVESKSIPSLLDTMKSQNFTPSLSFGYTAGASYASSGVPGSLILGGFDQARFTPSHVSFDVEGDENKTLPLSIESIIADNTLGGTLSLLPSGKAITTIVDSTTSQLWLPQNVCDLFAQAFRLKQDSYTGLYLVNNTIHRQLKQSNPSITFTVASPGSPSDTTDIVFPYAAFDLQAGIPFFNSSTNYFPIRVAANESQQVLGRAFLQEAYLFVDWERNNFTIGQAKHQNSTPSIIPVFSPSYDSRQNQSPVLSTAAIAGIAVAAAVLVIGIVVLLVIRSRRKRHVAAHYGDGKPAELEPGFLKPSEVMSAQVYELQEGESSRHELWSKEQHELQGDSLERELEGDSTRLSKNEKKHDVYELP